MTYPRVRYVPDWSGSMRQVAIYPQASPLQTTQFAAWNRNPYGVWSPSGFSPVTGLPYKGYYPGYQDYYPGYAYGLTNARIIPPQVSPWVPTSSFNPAGAGGSGHRGRHQGFSCGSGSCGFKSYGSRTANRSIGGVPVRPSLQDAEVEDIPILLEQGIQDSQGREENDWPLSF